MQQESSKAGKILIAEDDEINYLYISEILSDTNYELLWATNGKRAIELLKENPDISLVLLDIKMPVMNGYEVLEQIRLINAHLPVIAQTAYALSEDQERIKSAGFTDYISKPIKIDSLIELINKYL
jgi:CheY-like chemotaxis protein